MQIVSDPAQAMEVEAMNIPVYIMGSEDILFSAGVLAHLRLEHTARRLRGNHAQNTTFLNFCLVLSEPPSECGMHYAAPFICEVGKSELELVVFLITANYFTSHIAGFLDVSSAYDVTFVESQAAYTMRTCLYFRCLQVSGGVLRYCRCTVRVSPWGFTS